MQSSSYGGSAEVLCRTVAPSDNFSRWRLSQSFEELKQLEMEVRPLIEVELRTVRIMVLFRDEEASAHMQKKAHLSI